MRALQGLLALCLVGCFHTTDDPPDLPASIHDFTFPSETGNDPWSNQEEAPPGAPRLRHSKTLGQSEFGDRSASPLPPGAPSPPGGTTIIINNTIQQAAPSIVYPYAAPGLGYAPVDGGRTTPAGRNGGSPAGANAPPPVGGDWPQVPNYGPR